MTPTNPLIPKNKFAGQLNADGSFDTSSIHLNYNDEFDALLQGPGLAGRAEAEGTPGKVYRVGVGPGLVLEGDEEGDGLLRTSEAITAGTWSPVLSFGGASVGVAYGVRQGNWLKVGAWVFFSGIVALTSKGSSVGSAAISLPPFAATSYAACALAPNGSLVSNPAVGLVSGAGATTMGLWSSSGGNLGAVTDASVNNASSFIFSGQYPAS